MCGSGDESHVQLMMESHKSVSDCFHQGDLRTVELPAGCYFLGN